MANTQETMMMGPQGALYQQTLTNARPANVISQFNARMGEPFQVDPNPPHMPPVRYPDLFTIPGVMNNDPIPDYRKAAVATANDFNVNQDPMPMEVYWQANMGTTQLVEVGTELLSREELFRRAFTPQTQQRPAPWDFQR